MAAPCHLGTRLVSSRLKSCRSQVCCWKSLYSTRQREQTSLQGNSNRLTQHTGFLWIVSLRRLQPVLCHRSRSRSTPATTTCLSTCLISLAGRRCYSTSGRYAPSSNMLSIFRSSLGEVGHHPTPPGLLTLSKRLDLNLGGRLLFSLLNSRSSFSQQRHSHSQFSSIGIGQSAQRHQRKHCTMFKKKPCIYHSCDNVTPLASVGLATFVLPVFTSNSLTSQCFGGINFTNFTRLYATRRRSSASHYYDVLGLTPKATQKQIKSAYYEMSKKYHPDVSQGQGKKGHSLFTEITEAYEVLGNIQKRRMYDRGLLHERDPRSPYNPGDTDFPGSRGARQSPFERGERPPPPRGRSRVYNFDEFYKHHYSEVRERRSREWNEFVKQRDMMADHQMEQPRGISAPLMLLLWMLMALVILFFSDSLDDNRQRGYDPLHYSPSDNERRDFNK